MRRGSLIAGCACALLTAGCGGEDHLTRARKVPEPQAESHVFTVPAKLPPREREREAPRPAKAPAPAGAAPTGGAPSDTEVQQDLDKALGLTNSNRAVDQAGLSADGLASAPPSAPAKVAAIITAANQVARAPYRYGGGHGGVKGKEIWVDSAYDCSGSVSFALASAGYLDSPMDSTALARFGKPGPGKWVTIYANAGHAFMEVGGARFDTVGLRQSGSRWQPAYRSISGFTARHPPGL